MSVFSGKQYRGAMRAHRALKREEAELRAATVRPERSKVYRLGAASIRAAHRRALRKAADR